jgi:chromosome segregation ATPase
VPGMATVAEQIGALGVRVKELETWAGPGQASVLAAGLQAVRGDLAILRRNQESMLRAQRGLRAEVGTLRSTQEEHTRALAGLTSEVGTLKAGLAVLKADMGEMKETLREILRRLPPPAPAG